MKAILNGNKMVKIPHLFVEGQGTFYPTSQIAAERAYMANGVGMWGKTFAFNGQTFYQAGYTNVWN